MARERKQQEIIKHCSHCQGYSKDFPDCLQCNDDKLAAGLNCFDACCVDCKHEKSCGNSCELITDIELERSK